METFSALCAICEGNSPDPGEFPAQRPVTRSFDVFFDLRLNKQLSKQSWGSRFETLSRPLWRHCDDCCHSFIFQYILQTATFCILIQISLKFVWRDQFIINQHSFSSQPDIIRANAITLLQWRHNERGGVSNYQPHIVYSTVYSGADQRKTSNLRVTGLSIGNFTGEFPAQTASNAKILPFDDVIGKSITT